jgi:hypothetical protein
VASRSTVGERLASSRGRFGGWTLRELEGAAADVAAWRAALSPTSRYRLTLAMRQTLNAAVRWRYLRTNPVADAGANPAPRNEEFVPFTRTEIDALAAELASPCGPLIPGQVRDGEQRLPSVARPMGRSSSSPPKPACGRTNGQLWNAALLTGLLASSPCSDVSPTAY